MDEPDDVADLAGDPGHHLQLRDVDRDDQPRHTQQSAAGAALVSLSIGSARYDIFFAMRLICLHADEPEMPFGRTEALTSAIDTFPGSHPPHEEPGDILRGKLAE